MSKLIKAIIWLLPMAVVLCITMPSVQGGAVLDNGSVTLYLPTGGRSYQSMSVAEQRTATPLAFAMWRQQLGVEVANNELQRSARVGLMTINGDSTLALPTLPMLLPTSGNGCLVDTNTCYQLFGDHNPVGGSITLQGQSYTITGVFDWPQGMVVRQGDLAESQLCDRLTLSLPQTVNRVQQTEAFAMRHGLLPIATVSLGQWSAAEGFLTRLAPMVVLLWLLYISLSFIWARRATPVLAGLLLCGVLLGGTLLWWVAGLGFALPTQLLPARWSDFDFWVSAAQQLKDQLWFQLVLPKELPQAIPMVAVLRCAFRSIATVIICAVCINRLSTLRAEATAQPRS